MGAMSAVLAGACVAPVLISVLLLTTDLVAKGNGLAILLPFVMGVGYEAIKLAGRKDNKFTRFISAPGLWVQRITTREPEDDMIECAIASFVEVLPLDDKARTTAQTVLWTPYEEPKKDAENKTEETTES